MQSLTVAQESQLTGWIEEVRLHEHGALKWAKALWEINRSGFWKSQTDNWAKFCEETFGYSRTRAYEYVNAINFIEDQKLLAETNPDVEVPVSLSAVKRLKVERTRSIRPKAKAGPIRREPELPPVQNFVLPPKPPIDLQILLAAMEKEFDILLHRQDIPYEVLRVIHHLSTELGQARNMLQGVLPGFEEVVSKPKFRKPSLDEVQLFCEKSGIGPRDAEWFWNKMEGNGWKNAGKPVVDWHRTLIAWKLAGHLPSQKTFTANGSQVAKPPTLAQNQMARIQKDVARL